MRTFILTLLCLLSEVVSAAFPALEYSVPFTYNGFTYTDYAIFKIEDNDTIDYGVVYYANHQSAYNTTECNKDLTCEQSICYGAFLYVPNPDSRGTSGYLLQYTDLCGYIPHFSRKHDKNTGAWSNSGFENGSENLRVDRTIPLSQSTITTFPLSIGAGYHPANDDFLGDYGLGVVTFWTVVLEPNVPTFRNAMGSFYGTTGNYFGECLDYVEYETEIPDAICTGIAGNCFGQAQSKGYHTGSIPKIGSIIIFAVSTGLPNGHAGIVIAINGSNITMRDANWSPTLDGIIRDHTVDVSGYSVGYIYFSPYQ